MKKKESIQVDSVNVSKIKCESCHTPIKLTTLQQNELFEKNIIFVNCENCKEQNKIQVSVIHKQGFVIGIKVFQGIQNLHPSVVLARVYCILAVNGGQLSFVIKRRILQNLIDRVSLCTSVKINAVCLCRHGSDLFQCCVGGGGENDPCSLGAG